MFLLWPPRVQPREIRAGGSPSGAADIICDIEWYTSAVAASQILRDARRLAGFTQRELAERARMPQATVGRIEAGSVSPRVDTLEKLLRAADGELRVHARPGKGVDRSQIGELLRLTPLQRLDLAARDAAGLGRLQPRVGRS